MRVLFIDDRTKEVLDQWERSGCAAEHELLPLQLFQSVALTVETICRLQPDVIVIGHGLGTAAGTGSDVIIALQMSGWPGFVVANSGGGQQLFDRDGVTVDASADRDPVRLKTILTDLTTKQGTE